MSSNIAIDVQDVAKCYHLYASSVHRLKEWFWRPMRNLLRPAAAASHYYTPFWALQPLSFSVAKGESVGIIGSNGSGKSTLLQMICGTLTPTQGTIHTHGRVAALLELGSGFNPEFTGLENIYLNAALLGMPRAQVDQKLNAIVQFADIGSHLHQPLKTYSSGMAVRLAFAVQAFSEPDILVVDEALAVGDAKFQAKCFERIKQLREQGACILLVTHSSEQIVAHCDRAILLNQGQLVAQGPTRQVINQYHNLLFASPAPVDHSAAEQPTNAQSHSAPSDPFASRPGYNPHEHRWGDQAAIIHDFEIRASNESGSLLAYPAAIASGSTVELDVSIRILAAIEQPILGFTVKTKEGITLFGTNNHKLQHPSASLIWPQGSHIKALLRFTCHLAPGDYFLSLGVASMVNGELTPHDRRYDSIQLTVTPDPHYFGLANLGITLDVAPTAP